MIPELGACSLARAVSVPSPWRNASCFECGGEWQTRSLTARTCSPKCRAQLREREHGPTRGASPRKYSSEIVSEVRRLYESGMSIAEVQDAIGIGIKVETVMLRNGIARRRAIPRDPTGENNGMWRGNDARYQALHLRVAARRGKPSHCERCGTTDSHAKYEWANLTGNYADVDDYKRMCIPCHRNFDAARRRAARTSPEGGDA